MSAEEILRHYGDPFMFDNMMYVHAWMNGKENLSAPSNSIVDNL